LKLIRFALKEGLNLPVNYCSAVYKNRLQERGYLLIMAPLVKEGFEEVTSIGYIRQLSFQDVPANIKKFAKVLENKKYPKNAWSVNKDKTEILIHSSILKNEVFGKANLSIRYFEPKFQICNCPTCSKQIYREIILNPDKKIYIKKEVVAQKSFSSAAAIRTFEKLFVENIEDKEIVLGDFFKDYTFNTPEDAENMKKEIDILTSLKQWEYLTSDWPEIY
jgi:hypothetical protein